MAANGGQPPPSHYACKCLNIQIHSQPKPSEDVPPLVETGFKSVYVGEEGISVVRTRLKIIFCMAIDFIVARRTPRSPLGVVAEPFL